MGTSKLKFRGHLSTITRSKGKILFACFDKIMCFDDPVYLSRQTLSVSRLLDRKKLIRTFETLVTNSCELVIMLSLYSMDQTKVQLKVASTLAIHDICNRDVNHFTNIFYATRST